MTLKPVLLLALVPAVFSLPVLAAKPCEELRTEIAAKLDAKGVKGYTLDIVATEAADKLPAEKKVVGSCEAGSKKITYSRGG